MAKTEKLTASDWKKITRQRKIYFVLGSMETFQNKNTVFRHTMNDYILWMDAQALKNDPKTGMDQIFASLVAAQEK